jgi:Sensors of blue-light using FAD
MSVPSVDDLHFVYLSQLAPGRDPQVFGHISRHARLRNLERGIAGVLLFDGHRFAQWVYGPREAVRSLMGSVALDGRHTSLSVRLEAMLPALEPRPTWRSGRVSVEALDALAALKHVDGAPLFERLGQLIQQADMEPPLPVDIRRCARSRVGADSP